MKQAVVWWCLENRMGLEDLCKAASKIGYHGIELLEPERWGVAKNLGLEIASHRGHDSILEGLNEPRNHARIAQELRANIQLAARWNVPTLICFAGSVWPAPKDGAEMVAEGLAPVVKDAEEAGVNLALELLNSKLDHPHYQADQTTFGLRVLEHLASPRVGLLYDVYHMQIMEGDVIATIQNHHHRFLHYHTAGVPGRNDLDDAQELNYSAIAQTIRATNFAGFVGHEFLPKSEPVAALRQAFDIFKP